MMDEAMTDAGDGRDLLRRGDAFAKACDVASAVREYLAYCAHVERHGAGGAAPSALRLVAVRKQVVEMMPQRRDVRRTLAENYVQLGLIDEAREELRRLWKEWEVDGNTAARDEVLARLTELG
jgi:hypothetical protein